MSVFKFFRCSNDFITQKVLGDNEDLVQVSLILIDQQGLGHFFGYHRPLLPTGWRIVQILRQRPRIKTNIVPATLSAIKEASQLIHFYQCTIVLHL